MYTAAHDKHTQKRPILYWRIIEKRKSLYRKNKWENISGNKKAEKLDSQSLIRNRLYIRPDLIEESDEEAVWKSFYNESFFLKLDLKFHKALVQAQFTLQTLFSSMIRVIIWVKH